MANIIPEWTCQFEYPSGNKCGTICGPSGFCFQHKDKELVDPVVKRDAIPDPVGIHQLLSQRGSVYGDIRHNTNCQAQLKDTYNGWLEIVWGEKQSLNRGFKEINDRVAHDECIEYVLEKIARIATGNLHEDNYKDIGGYIELARKIAMGEPTKVP